MATQDVFNSLVAAVDWLEANPHQHGFSTLAQTEDKKDASPFGEEVACFCALGRFAVERNLGTRFETFDVKTDSEDLYQMMNKELEPLGISTREVFRANDMAGTPTCAPPTRRRAAIKKLRVLIEGIKAHLDD